MDHLVSKLKYLKESVTSWTKPKKAEDWDDFSFLEEHIRILQQKNPDLSVSEEYVLLTKEFEKEKDLILK